jgi:hypothetical protein
LIGVLTGTGGEDLEQLIVDPRLAPARVAKRERLRVANWPDAVGEIALEIARPWRQKVHPSFEIERGPVRAEAHARQVRTARGIRGRLGAGGCGMLAEISRNISPCRKRSPFSASGFGVNRMRASTRVAVSASRKVRWTDSSRSG